MDEHVGALSTSRRARAAKQLRGRVRGSTRESGACPPCGRSGRARDPHWITVALPYPLSFVLCEIRPKLNWSQIFTKKKVVQKFVSYKPSFGGQS